jgi:hypothetical protein
MQTAVARFSRRSTAACPRTRRASILRTSARSASSASRQFIAVNTEPAYSVWGHRASNKTGWVYVFAAGCYQELHRTGITYICVRIRPRALYRCALSGAGAAVCRQRSRRNRRSPATFRRESESRADACRTARADRFAFVPLLVWRSVQEFIPQRPMLIA